MFEALPQGQFLSANFSAILKDHAIRSCNFEAPVKGYGQPIAKAGPHLAQHAGAPSLLEEAGFNVINLANNHIFDYGEPGLRHSLEAFRTAVCTGAGKTPQEAYALKRMQVGTVTVGLLSFCEAEFGALTLYHTEGAGYAWVNHPSVNELVKNAKQEVDVLLVQCHAGVEQIDLPLPEWRARYRELVQLGADAVIGCHPHVPQGWETYLGKPIFYSLGNFYFDSNSDHPLWNKGIAVSLLFDKDRLVSFDVIRLSRSGNMIDLHDEPTFIAHLSHLNDLLNEPGYNKAIQQIALELWNKYYRDYYSVALHGIDSKVSLPQSIKTFVKRVFFRRKTNIHFALLLHNIRIESHRWIVERALAQLIK